MPPGPETRVVQGRKEKTRGQRQEDAANAKGELADTTASRDEDQKSAAEAS